jgi:hypothetical protein
MKKKKEAIREKKRKLIHKLWMKNYINKLLISAFSSLSSLALAAYSPIQNLSLDWILSTEKSSRTYIENVNINKQNI